MFLLKLYYYLKNLLLYIRFFLVYYNYKNTYFEDCSIINVLLIFMQNKYNKK